MSRTRPYRLRFHRLDNDVHGVVAYANPEEARRAADAMRRQSERTGATVVLTIGHRDGDEAQRFADALEAARERALNDAAPDPTTGRTLATCAYPHDTAGEHNHDDCTDALAELAGQQPAGYVRRTTPYPITDPARTAALHAAVGDLPTDLAATNNARHRRLIAQPASLDSIDAEPTPATWPTGPATCPGHGSWGSDGGAWCVDHDEYDEQPRSLGGPYFGLGLD